MKPRKALDKKGKKPGIIDKAVDKLASKVSKGADTVYKAAASTDSEATKKNRAAMEEVMGGSPFSRGYKRK